MLLASARPIPVSVSLGVITAVLLVTVALSLRASGHAAAQPAPATERG